jgi:hypothetical protein
VLDCLSRFVGYPNLRSQINVLSKKYAVAAVRDRSAIPALVLGLLALPFGVLSPFAICTGIRSLRRIQGSGGTATGRFYAAVGLVGGVIGAAFLVGGVIFWLATS